jgi:glutamate/tyrosine decarboxylase-like PLP-dependent enzyme
MMTRTQLRQTLLHDAASRALGYLDGLDQRPVAPSPEAVRRLSELRQPLPAAACDPAEVLRCLDEIVSPATVASAGPRYFGFVIGGALPVTVAANWLATAWDQNAVLHATSPAAAVLEEVALSWLVELLGLPYGSGGAFVTGATMANFTALAAARRVVLARAGWDVEADGLFGAPPISVALGEEAHPSVIKALALLGLGRSRIVRVPADRQGRLRADLLPRLEPPAIVCLQAGNVNTGAFDPFAEASAKARAAGAWVHVDGAFGLWARAAPLRAHLADGIEQADSWACDAHKWLNVPYNCGLAFVRDAAALRAAMTLNAPYLPQGEQREPAQYTPELSRRARGVEVWAALRSLGRAGLAELIERNCRQAARLAEGLRAAGLSVLNEVTLNQVLVSFGDASQTQRVIAAVQAEGTCWAGGTVWQGQTAMRISVSSWATTDADIERSLEAILRSAAQCGATAGAPAGANGKHAWMKGA